jgi:hypothetical protein
MLLDFNVYLCVLSTPYSESLRDSIEMPLRVILSSTGDVFLVLLKAQS